MAVVWRIVVHSRDGGLGYGPYGVWLASGWNCCEWPVACCRRRGRRTLRRRRRRRRRSRKEGRKKEGRRRYDIENENPPSGRVVGMKMNNDDVRPSTARWVARPQQGTTSARSWPTAQSARWRSWAACGYGCWCPLFSTGNPYKVH